MSSSIRECFSKLINSTKHLDFVGPKYEFENDNSTRFQTIGGFCFSFLIIMSCSIIGFLFGKEIYEKKNPIVSISQEFVSFSDVYLNEFPLMFTFTTKNGTNLDLDSLNGLIEPIIFSQKMDLKGIVHDIKDFYSFEKCDEKRFKKYSNLVSSKRESSDKTLICIKFDENTFFSNYYLSNNSSNFNIMLKKCIKNDTEMCNNDVDIIIEDMLITVIYPTSFVNFLNFSNPVDIYLDEMTTQSSNYLTRRSYMRFSYNGFTSDNGIILTDVKNENFISLISVVPDDLVYNKEGFSKDALFWLALESPRIKNLISRRYMKAQELLATLGGLANALTIMGYVFSYHYLRFLYLENIRESILFVLNEKLEKQNSFAKMVENSREDEAYINSLLSNKANIMKNNFNLLENNDDKNYNIQNKVTNKKDRKEYNNRPKMTQNLAIIIPKKKVIAMKKLRIKKVF